MPYCPRCGTALSSHELGQPDVYRDEEDESAYVRLRLVDADGVVAAAVGGGAEWLGVWTTTPWTLLSNTGVAVNPDLVYAVVDGVVHGRRPGGRRHGGGRVGPGDGAGPGHGAGRAALRASVRRRGGAPWCGRVAGGAGLLRDDRGGDRPGAPGTGLRRNRPPDRARERPALVEPGRARWHASPTRVAWLAGRHVREANHDINDRLESTGLLLRRFPYVHSYPHCWRCRTPLIYWGKPSWYIATSTRKADLLAAEPDGGLAPGVHQGRPLRRVAGEQCRLGPVARPLLGDAAADLALRPRARALRRIPARAVGAVRAGRDGHRPAPADH